jgi:hypothetical protein
MGSDKSVMLMGAGMQYSEANPGAPEPSPAQLEEFLADDFLKSMQEDGKRPGEEVAPGVVLGEPSIDFDDQEMTVVVGFSFDHIDKLDAIRQEMSSASDDGPPGFGGDLDIAYKGRRMDLAGDPLGLAELKKLVDGEDGAMAGMMLADSTYVWELVTDLKIKKNNATERDGNVLRWKYSFEDAAKGAAPIQLRLVGVQKAAKKSEDEAPKKATKTGT